MHLRVLHQRCVWSQVTVYNKRKLIHDHEIGSSHINLAHLNKSPGAEVRMVLMGKGQQQGEVSFMPELRVAGGATGGAAGHAAPAVAAGGLAAGGGAAGGCPACRLSLALLGVLLSGTGALTHLCSCNLQLRMCFPPCPSLLVRFTAD